MSTVLVTGGAGFIGSHTIVELLENGINLISLDNYINSSPAVYKNISKINDTPFKFYEADLLDLKAIENIFSENNIDAVIHFAGLKAVGESNKIPLSYYQNNITGTLNLLKVMDKYNCNQLVFSSSATVYGNSTDLPFKETHPTSATNPYGRTKLFIEEIIKDYQKSQPNFSAVILRYFNPVGAHPSGLIGEDPKGIPNNLMPYISKVAKGELPELQIFGNDYPTKDGTGVRDYIHVVDLAKGHIKALEFAGKNGGCEVFNLGTGVGYSVLEMVAAYEKASGKKVPFKIVGRREGDIAECYACVEKSAVYLKWKSELCLSDMCF